MLYFSNSGRRLAVHGIAAAAITGVGLGVVRTAAAQTAPTAPPATADSAKVLWHKVPYDVENGRDADAALVDGIRAFNAHDWDLAIAAFSKALEIRPKFADASYNRGLAFLYVKDYDRAIAEFTTVIEAKPKLWDAWTERGEAWLGRGDFGKAQADAEASLKIKPANEYAIDLLKRIREAKAAVK